MSIQYDLYDTPDIQQTGDAQRFIPRSIQRNRRSGRISRPCTQIHRNKPQFTGGRHAVFQNELRDLIANGWIVELGDIGYFSVSLKRDLV